MSNNYPGAAGFTLIELVLVTVILSILAAFALPRVVNLESTARAAVLESVAGTMHSTINIVKLTARAQGLSPVATNPGGTEQLNYAIETEAGISEVDWRNLCPESQAEVGDRLTMADYISMSHPDGDLLVDINNQSTTVGYNLAPGGCFVTYDSFACSVTQVLTSC